MKNTPIRMFVVASIVALGLSALPSAARAHCDRVDGPVVSDARAALKAGRVEAVLKWISATHEAEVRRAFAHTLRVRSLNKRARALADKYFFETLVRLHRAGEGAPYTGLKRAGSKVEPPVAAADRALQRKSVGPLARAVATRVKTAIEQHFARVVKLRRVAERSPAHGRRYVAAYVKYVHFVRGIHIAASGGKPHAH